MEEDDRLQQEEELLALQAIYGDNCVVDSASCEACSMQLCASLNGALALF